MRLRNRRFRSISFAAAVVSSAAFCIGAMAATFPHIEREGRYIFVRYPTKLQDNAEIQQVFGDHMRMIEEFLLKTLPDNEMSLDTLQALHDATDKLDELIPI